MTALRDRNRLVEEHVAIARGIARRFAGRGEALEDLEQTAMVGLIHAADRYDPERGEFMVFAVPTIMGEVRRHFRDRSWATHVPRRLKELRAALTRATEELSQRLGRAPTAKELAAATGAPIDDVFGALHAAASYRATSLQDLLEHDRDGTADPGVPDRAIELMIDLTSLAPAVAALPAPVRTILVLRFYHDLTQTQIAERVGTSQITVSRVLSRTLASLRHHVDPR